MSSPDMRIQHEIEKTEMTQHNNSWSCRGSKGGSTMRVLAIPAAPCIKINKEKIVICLLYCLYDSAAP
jgi:hypothetical protein